MSNDEGSPSTLGSIIKKALGVFKPKATTHKLGQSPIPLTPEVLSDPSVIDVINQSRDIHDETVQVPTLPTKPNIPSKKKSFSKSA